jgi:hypothetical protein
MDRAVLSLRQVGPQARPDRVCGGGARRFGPADLLGRHADAEWHRVAAALIGDGGRWRTGAAPGDHPAAHAESGTGRSGCGGEARAHAQRDWYRGAKTAALARWQALDSSRGSLPHKAGGVHAGRAIASHSPAVTQRAACRRTHGVGGRHGGEGAQTTLPWLRLRVPLHSAAAGRAAYLCGGHGDLQTVDGVPRPHEGGRHR